MIGVKGPIVVLVLISPEPKHYNKAPVIVGTNTFLFHKLWLLLEESGDEDIVCSMRIQPVDAPVQVQTQLSQSVAVDDATGQAKWKDLVHSQ